MTTQDPKNVCAQPTPRNCPFTDCRRYCGPYKFCCSYHLPKVGSPLWHEIIDLMADLFLDRITPSEFSTRERQIIAQILGCPFVPDV